MSLDIFSVLLWIFCKGAKLCALTDKLVRHLFDKVSFSVRFDVEVGLQLTIL